MVDVSHSPALGYVQVVHQRDAATLLPIIQQHTKPNTEVHSDEWAAYNNVASLPNVSTHKTVNHSLHFKDPLTGVQHRKLLVQDKNHAQAYEGLPSTSAPVVPRRVYVARAPRKDSEASV